MSISLTYLPPSVLKWALKTSQWKFYHSNNPNSPGTTNLASSTQLNHESSMKGNWLKLTLGLTFRSPILRTACLPTYHLFICMYLVIPDPGSKNDSHYGTIGDDNKRTKNGKSSWTRLDSTTCCLIVSWKLNYRHQIYLTGKCHYKRTP